MAVKVHVVYDFMHLYYKYKFMRESGRLKDLTATTVDGPVDVTNVYYPLMDLENWRKGVEQRFGNDAEVCMSICFDSPPTERKKLDTTNDYKANRVSKITDGDSVSLYMLRVLLEKAGYNVYLIPGEEADDLVASLVAQYTPQFEATYVMTNDSDLLAQVQPKVHVCRYKARQGYTEVGCGNYEAYCSREFGVCIPYNAIMLYKALVGDKSDNIAGVKGFGPKAYESLVERAEGMWDFSKFSQAASIAEFIDYAALKGDGKQQALHSLELVMPRTDLQVALGPGISTLESRKAAYMDTYGFKSLV